MISLIAMFFPDWQLSKKLEEIVEKREKLILEKVEQAHMRYDEHNRAEIGSH